MHLAYSSVQYGSILAVYIDKIPIDHTISGDNTV